MSNTRARQVGDSVPVTDSALRLAPWRAAASWSADKVQASTASEVLRLAGLDWRVEQLPMTAQVLTAHGVTSVPVPDKVANTRVNLDGTAAVVGVTSPSYSVLQNVDTAELVDAITYEAGATYDSAGELRGGARIFVAAKLPDTLQVGGVDQVDSYLVVRNGHDGWQPLQLTIMHLRLACTNGMTRWAQQANMTLRHTAKMQGRVEQARAALQLTLRERDGFSTWAQGLLQQRTTDQEFWQLVQELVPVDGDATDRAKASAERTRDTLMGIWHGSTQEAIKGTAWGAYQAVVEHEQWARPVRAQGMGVVRARGERVLTATKLPMQGRVLELLGA